MTKNRIILSTIASSLLIVAVVFQNAVYAQDAPTSGVPNQGIRSQNKDNRGSVRDLRGQGKETRVERTKLRGANILSSSVIRRARITKVANKITSVAQKFIDKGIDVGEAQNFAQSAHDKIAEVSAMQAEAQAILDGLTADTIKTGAADFKAKMFDINKVLGEGRKDLMSAAQALKTARSSAKTTETTN